MILNSVSSVKQSHRMSWYEMISQESLLPLDSDENKDRTENPSLKKYTSSAVPEKTSLLSRWCSMFIYVRSSVYDMFAYLACFVVGLGMTAHLATAQTTTQLFS